MKNSRKCRDCGVKISGHPNRKNCEPCAIARRKKPRGTMSEDQIIEAISLAGSMPRGDIAKELGVSSSNLKRSCPGVSFYYFQRYAANPQLVKDVCDYYEKNGKRKTQEKFPDICVRSIVERYDHAPRQSRWTDEQIVQAVKYGPFLSFKEQAERFNRPLAFEGSIRSLWEKRLAGSPSTIHGLSWNRAKHIVKKTCPTVKTGVRAFARFHLWVDIEKHLLPDTHEIISESVKVMAEFQRWIYGENVRDQIRKIRQSEKGG